ncbi:MAG: hypothetical protein ABIO06_05825 [Pseudolysinimonas sp.]
MPLPAVLTTLDIPAPELGGMRLDGEVYRLADGWCTIDVLETPAHRARAVRGLRSERLIAELGTAAWVWGVTPVLPRMIEFCADLGARARLRISPLVRVRELVLDPGDRVDLGGSSGAGSSAGSSGAAVTSRLRTVVDLARFRETIGDEDATSIVELARDGGFGLAECRELMDRRRNLPEKRRALVRLSGLL